MTLIGLDAGQKRIGVAVSDPGESIALGSSVIELGENEDLGDAIGSVRRLVIERRARRVVVGLPLRTSGEPGPEAERVQAFASKLREALDDLAVEVVLWDERFSTAQADTMLRRVGLSGRRRRALLDQTAAALILQSYIDRTRRDEEGKEGSSWSRENESG